MSQLMEARSQEIQVTSPELDLMSQQAGVDIWGILARRKWLVILGMILGSVLGYIYLLQADPVYESVAQVLIEEKQAPSLPFAGFDTELVVASEEAKHAVVIRSPRILRQAFKDYSLEKLPTFLEDPQPLVSLAEQLDVEIVEEGTHVLNVSYRGPNPDDTQKVTGSIVRTYQKFLEEAYKDTGQQTRDLIVKAKDDLLQKWEKLESEYREFRSTAPLMYRGEKAVNMHQDRQADYEQERTKLQKQITELQARIKAVHQALETKEGLESVLLLAGQEGSDLVRNGLSLREAYQRDRYMSLLLRDSELSGQYGPDHPDVVTVRRQLTKYREQFPDIDKGGSIRLSPEELLGFATNYLGALRQKLIQYQDQFTRLDQLFVEEEDASKKLQSYQDQDDQFRKEIDRTQQLFEVVVKSLEQVSMVSDYEGYNYQTLAEPGPGEKVAPLPIKILPLSAILGMMAGFGIAYLVDIADKAFRTADEVSQVMRLPVIGHIPLIEPRRATNLPNCDISPAVCTVHRPKSPESESYRAIRTAIYFNSRDRRHQVIQVTSPMPGDGKSTLAANLAVTIAQSGRSVLLLDADFRRPSLHKVFGIPATDIGLASVVSGDAEPADAMQSFEEVPNLKLMACGHRPSNPSELLSSEQFADVLEMLRERFDFVIVDTPPVLVVSDPSAVAARVDGVLLTLRIHKRARPLAVRARDALVAIGATVIGVVVNGVDQETGGYYGQYRYGYAGYGYAYNYGYGYGDYGSEANETKAIKQYYDEDGRSASGGIAPQSGVTSEVGRQ